MNQAIKVEVQLTVQAEDLDALSQAIHESKDRHVSLLEQSGDDKVFVAELVGEIQSLARLWAIVIEADK